VDWVEAALEEYKSLREESLTAMRGQQAILSFGTATLAVSIAAGFNVWDKAAVLPEAIFLFFVPVIAYLVLIIWMGEVARMMRVGWYIAIREGEINAKIPAGEGALAWETYLRTKTGVRTPQLVWNYKAIIALFILVAGAAAITGNYKSYDGHSLRWLILIDLFEVALLGAVIGFVFLQATRFK
jgi:hypothetical protein